MSNIPNVESHGPVEYTGPNKPIGTSYEIERWSGVLHGQKQLPIIYIKPDANFINYIKDNNHRINVKIVGTGRYDNRIIEGSVNRSANFPNYRPNLFNKTGLYTITLQSPWYGYPYKMGNIYIQDLPNMNAEGFDNNKYHNTNILNNVRNVNKDIATVDNTGLSSEQLFWILISVLLGVPLILLIFIFFIKIVKQG